MTRRAGEERGGGQDGKQKERITRKEIEETEAEEDPTTRRREGSNGRQQKGRSREIYERGDRGNRSRGRIYDMRDEEEESRY